MYFFINIDKITMVQDHGFTKAVHNLVIFKLMLNNIQWDQECYP